MFWWPPSPSLGSPTGWRSVATKDLSAPAAISAGGRRLGWLLDEREPTAAEQRRGSVPAPGGHGRPHGRPRDPQAPEYAKAMLEQLAWWASALRKARSESDYPG